MSNSRFTILVIVLVAAIFGTLCLGLAFIGAQLGAVIFGVLAALFAADAFMRVG